MKAAAQESTTAEHAAHTSTTTTTTTHSPTAQPPLLLQESTAAQRIIHPPSALHGLVQRPGNLFGAVPNFTRGDPQQPHGNNTDTHTAHSTNPTAIPNMSIDNSVAPDAAPRCTLGTATLLPGDLSSHASAPTWSHPHTAGSIGLTVAQAQVLPEQAAGCRLPPITDLLRILSHDQNMSRQTHTNNSTAVQPPFAHPYPQNHYGSAVQHPIKHSQLLQQHSFAQPYPQPQQFSHPHPRSQQHHFRPHQGPSTRPARAAARATRGASNGSSPTSLSASDSVEDETESALSASLRNTDESIGFVAADIGGAPKLNAQSPVVHSQQSGRHQPHHHQHQQQHQQQQHSRSPIRDGHPYHRVPPRLSLKPVHFVPPPTHATNQFQTSTPYSAAPSVHVKQEGFNPPAIISTPMTASSQSSSVYSRNNYPPYYSNHQPSTPPTNMHHHPPQHSRTYSPIQATTALPPFSAYRFPSEQQQQQQQAQRQHDTRQQAQSFPQHHHYAATAGHASIPINSASSSNHREKPHTCTDCPKAFARSNDLKRHQLTHTPEEKPYACQWCGKKFSRPDSVRKHEASVVEGRRVRCSGNVGSE
ncbi:hypothetical protein CcCBS67573_g09517 [Chytriomyces confervae]|uniref:C2H2-type domain-containing protein n=1 Tax=Chytriomyces confervae TaxID=246404 RepID=A0A507DV22_9FUNG|nr:hypothetical protein CcCBS67573_g09517 [Chytriomyces confervae]